MCQRWARISITYSKNVIALIPLGLCPTTTSLSHHHALDISRTYAVRTFTFALLAGQHVRTLCRANLRQSWALREREREREAFYHSHNARRSPRTCRAAGARPFIDRTERSSPGGAHFVDVLSETKRVANKRSGIGQYVRKPLGLTARAVRSIPLALVALIALNQRALDVRPQISPPPPRTHIGLAERFSVNIIHYVLCMLYDSR